MVASFPPVLARIHRFFAGTDGPERPALPVGEFFHPLSLASVLLLVVNDHALKGSALPPWLTGKLSDFSGLLFFPLLMTATLDVCLMAAARLGAAVDFSLRTWKLAAATSLTAAIFAGAKLIPGVAASLERLLGLIGFPSRIVCDPSDLLALPMLGVAWWIGRSELRRIPLGRVEVVLRALERGTATASAALADVRALRPDEAGLIDEFTDALTRGLASGDFAAATAQLNTLRGEDER